MSKDGSILFRLDKTQLIRTYHWQAAGAKETTFFCENRELHWTITNTGGPDVIVTLLQNDSNTIATQTTLASSQSFDITTASGLQIKQAATVDASGNPNVSVGSAVATYATAP